MSDKTAWEGHGQHVRDSHWAGGSLVPTPGTRPEKKVRWNLSPGVLYEVVGITIGNSWLLLTLQCPLWEARGDCHGAQENRAF